MKWSLRCSISGSFGDLEIPLLFVLLYLLLGARFEFSDKSSDEIWVWAFMLGPERWWTMGTRVWNTTKNLKKVSDQFFFFQYLYIFKRITSQKHQHATTHTGHVQGDIKFINLLQSLLPEDSDSFQQIHLWSKIGYRSKSWNCYQKLLIQKYFCSINYKTNNNKNLPEHYHWKVIVVLLPYFF